MITSTEIAEIFAAVPVDLKPRLACACLINSRAEEFDNATSDIDVMLIVSSEEELPSYGVPVGTKIEFFVTSTDTVRRMLSLTTDWKNLNYQNLDFIHKIRRAVPLSNAGFLEELRRPIDWNAFDKENSIARLADAQTMVLDSIGTYSAGDLVGTVVNLRRMSGFCVDAVTSLEGESQPREKWRFKKIRRAFGPESWLERAYARIELGPGYHSKDGLEEMIEYSMNFGRTMQFLTISPDARSLFDDPGECKGLFQHPRFSWLRRVESGFAIFQPQSNSKLSPILARLWFCAAHIQDIGGIGRFVWPPAAERPMSVERVQKGIEELVRAGLLLPR